MNPGRNSLKGGGFRVKTALRRKSKERMLVVARTAYKFGSVVGGSKQEPRAGKESSQSFSWVSKRNGEAGRVKRPLALDTRNASNEFHGSHEKIALTSNNAAATEYLSAGLTVDQQRSPRGGQTIGYEASKSQFKILKRPVTTNPMLQENRQRAQSKF